MANEQPFYPHYGTNQVVTPAAASATIAINADDKQVRIANSGAGLGYFRTFSSLSGALTASTADCPVLAGSDFIATKDPSHDRLAHISAAGTTFNVMTGEGFD